MKPDKFVLSIVVFLGLLAFIGGIVISGSTNYDVTPSDPFVQTLTGNNYSEYQQKIEEIKVTAEDDGVLAQFKLGKAVYNVVTSSLGQVGALVTNIFDFIEIPNELVGLIIVVIAIAVIFGGLYLIIS